MTRPGRDMPGVSALTRIRYLAAMLVAMLCWTAGARPDTAFIPYRVENPSASFPVDSGAEYARLLGLALVVRKGAEVYSPRELADDLGQKSIATQGTVTEEDLHLLGKGRYIDHIVIGTLYRARGAYTSESLLYSVADRKILMTTRVRSADLFELAEKEIAQVFARYPDRPRGRGREAVDAVFVVDASTNTSGEWDSVRRAVMACAERLSGRWSADTRLHLIPYSERISFRPSMMSLRGSAGLSAALEQIRPAGGNSAERLEQALASAVRDVRWRSGARRSIIIIHNSPLERSRYLGQHAYFAKRAGIALSTVALGRVSPDGRAVLREASSIAGGLHYNAAYRQRLFDREGREIDAYMQDGRLFEGLYPEARWHEGLFTENAQRHQARARPRPFLKEHFVDTSRRRVSPYSLKEKFPEVTGQPVINAGPLESNLVAVLGQAAESIAGAGGAQGLAGRVMLSDGANTIWVGVAGEREMEFLRARHRQKIFFRLGVSPQRREEEPFGVAFDPQCLITGVSEDQVPAMAQASIESIITRPAEYCERGLFNPPVWFVRVRVEKVMKYGGGEDIRQSSSP